MANEMDVRVWEDRATLDDKDKRDGYLLHAGDRFGAQMLEYLKKSIEASSSDVLEVVAYDGRNGRLRLKLKS